MYGISVRDQYFAQANRINKQSIWPLGSYDIRPFSRTLEERYDCKKRKSFDKRPIFFESSYPRPKKIKAIKCLKHYTNNLISPSASKENDVRFDVLMYGIFRKSVIQHCLERLWLTDVPATVGNLSQGRFFNHNQMIKTCALFKAIQGTRDVDQLNSLSKTLCYWKITCIL